jgi:hypothetical protein
LGISPGGKYNLLPEGTYMPAVSAVGGVGFPTGHASRLNPALMGADAIGTGSFNFITGVNLFKYLKPFLVHSQIWMNTPINMNKITDDPTRNVRSREYLTVNWPRNPFQRWIHYCLQQLVLAKASIPFRAIKLPDRCECAGINSSHGPS